MKLVARSYFAIVIYSQVYYQTRKYQAFSSCCSQKTRFKIPRLLSLNSKRSDANSSQVCQQKLSLVLKYRFRD